MVEAWAARHRWGVQGQHTGPDLPGGRPWEVVVETTEGVWNVGLWSLILIS